MKEIQQSLKIFTERSNNDETSYSDDNDNEILLPLMEYTDFETLNVQLKTKVNFRQKIVSFKHVNCFIFIFYFIFNS